jgi:hypothetical protein
MRGIACRPTDADAGSHDHRDRKLSASGELMQKRPSNAHALIIWGFGMKRQRGHDAGNRMHFASGPCGFDAWPQPEPVASRLRSEQKAISETLGG